MTEQTKVLLSQFSFSLSLCSCLSVSLSLRCEMKCLRLSTCERTNKTPRKTWSSPLDHVLRHRQKLRLQSREIYVENSPSFNPFSLSSLTSTNFYTRPELSLSPSYFPSRLTRNYFFHSCCFLFVLILMYLCKSHRPRRRRLVFRPRSARTRCQTRKIPLDEEPSRVECHHRDL